MVDVKVPARIQLMQDATLNGISIAQMIDPLTQSEVSRIEEKVNSFERIVFRAMAFLDEFETYKKAVADLAIELGVLHKNPLFAGPIKGNKNPMLVISAVGSAFGISPKQIMKGGRPYHIALTRMVAMYIVRDRLGFGLKQTGEIFKKDHGTVLHAVKTIKNLMSKECPKNRILGMGRKAFRNKVKALADQFEASEI